MREITINAFRELQTLGSENRNQVYGAFAIGRVHAQQCENLKIGDNVFFFDVQPNPKDADVKETLTVTQAVIVEAVTSSQTFEAGRHRVAAFEKWFDEEPTEKEKGFMLVAWEAALKWVAAEALEVESNTLTGLDIVQLDRIIVKELDGWSSLKNG